MLHNLLLSLFSLSIALSAIPLLAQDSLLVEALKQSTHSLQIEDNRFAGEGAEVLRNAMQDKQFLLVGEQHGIKEVSQFTKVLFLEAHPLGFQYLCIETDPFVARKLEELARKDVEALRSFCTELPFTIPFYDNEDDYVFLKKVVETSDAEGSVFWGVDQVFAAAPRYLFSRLAEMAPNDEARQLALEYLETGKEGLKHFMSSGDMSKSLLSSLGPEDYQKLFAAFGEGEDKESTRILKGIQKTQEIYGYYYAGKQYDNNRSRVRLMKKQFMYYYREAQEETDMPKVVFKFGATHTYRGLSYYDQFDLGNMVSELAESNGSGSLHIHFSGLKGVANSGLSGPQEFDNTDDLHPLLWQAIKDRSEGEGWILVDLRPLRHRFNSKKIKPLRDLVYSYDMYVLVPEASPVKPIGQ